MASPKIDCREHHGKRVEPESASAGQGAGAADLGLGSDVLVGSALRRRHHQDPTSTPETAEPAWIDDHSDVTRGGRGQRPPIEPTFSDVLLPPGEMISISTCSVT